MSVNYHRKCSKCGRTRAEDVTVTYHRFPNPGKKNVAKARAWANFCWPNQDWNSVESLHSLHISNKVLCGRHFNESQFYDNKRQKLNIFAVPDSTDPVELLNDKENLFIQNVEQSHAAGQRTSSTSKSTINKQNVEQSSTAGQRKSRMQFSKIENLQVEPSTYSVLTPQTPIEVSSTSKSAINKENVDQSRTAGQRTSSVPFSKKDIMQVEPSTHCVLTPQNPIEVSSTSKSAINKQNMEQSSTAGQLTSRMPFSKIENMPVEPSTYCVLTPQTPIEVSSTSKSTINKQNATTTKPTPESTTSKEIHSNVPHVEPQSASKCSGILSAINIKKLSELTPREFQLYKICQKKLKEIARLRKHLKKKKAHNLIKGLSEDENVQKLCNLNISNSFAVLLQNQLKNCPRKPKGRRYTLKQKIMALVIYKKSPACYRLLRRMFALPCQSSLNKLLNKVPLRPGINGHIFTALKKMAQNQTDEENISILSFDEMSIRKHLYYDSKLDEIQGFQDHGNHGRSNEVATKAVVFMLSGLRKKWKQPIAFYLSHSLTADRLTVILKEVLKECFDANMNVVATVCDLSTVNLRVLRTLGATTRDPFFSLYGREVVTILDPPHLLKCTRNLLMKHNVECTTELRVNGDNIKGEAKWGHIEAFYKLDKNNPNFVFAPALTDSHLYPNVKQQMRVKLAAQVFSHSVAAGILAKIASNELPTEAHATATFLKKFDELFDAVNADSPDLRRGKKYSTNLTARSPHISLFREMSRFISSMKYVGCKSNPPSQEGWIHTMNAIEKLWKNLQAINIKSVSTRRLNQDPLENFFGCVRYSCGSNSNPTVQQFVAGVKTAIISNLRHTSQKKNCEDDAAILTNNLSSFLTSETTMKNFEMVENNYNIENIEKLLSDAAEEVERMGPESQACGYVCGFIFKKLSNNDCAYCRKAFLTNAQEAIHIFASLKEYKANCNSLNYPCKDMVECVETMATIINDYLQSFGWKPRVKQNIMDILEVDYHFLNKCKKHLESNKEHVKKCAFFICIKRYIMIKNREMEDGEKRKAMERKIKILKNK